MREHGAAALAANPGNAYGHYLLALGEAMGPRSVKPGDPRPDLDEILRAIELEPNENLFRFHASRLYVADHPEKSLEQLDEAVRIAPSSDAAWLLHGWAFVLLGKKDEAWRDFDHALELAADPCPVRFSRASLITGRASPSAIRNLSEESYNRAVAELNAALILHPDKPYTLWLRGQLHFYSHRNMDAGMEDFNRLIDRCPKSLEANMQLMDMAIGDHVISAMRTAASTDVREIGPGVEKYLQNPRGFELVDILEFWIRRFSRPGAGEVPDPPAWVRELRFRLAAVHAAKGRPGEAAGALEQLCGSGWRDWTRFDATKAFDEIRSDERVAELRKKFPPPD